MLVLLLLVPALPWCHVPVLQCCRVPVLPSSLVRKMERTVPRGCCRHCSGMQACMAATAKQPASTALFEEGKHNRPLSLRLSWYECSPLAATQTSCAPAKPLPL